MTTYSVTPLGWQYALRCDGALVKVYDSKEGAEEAKRELSRRA